MGALLDGNNIGQRNATHLGFFVPRFRVFLVVLGQVEVNVHLKNLEAVVRGGTEAHVLCDLLLHLIKVTPTRLAKVYITVEPTGLQFDNLVLGLPHNVSYTFRSVEVRSPVGDNQVFRRDVQRNLPLQCRVVIHLLEGITTQPQTPQHPLMLGPILRHDLGQLKIHILRDVYCRFFLLRRLLTNDGRLHRPRRGESFHDGFGLELDESF